MDNRFTSAVTEIKISKAAINFKIDIVNFIDKHPKMQISCISHFYLKSNSRVIKEICQEYASKFQ